MRQISRWANFTALELFLALALFCGWTAHAQHVFAVGGKVFSERQMNSLRADMPQAKALSMGLAKTPVTVSLAGVNPETAGVVLVNEGTGRYVVLSGIASRCAEIVLTPLLMAELKQAGLGEADTYLCMVVDNLEKAIPFTKSAYTVSAATLGVECPVFNYGQKDNVKTTTLDQRRLIGVSQISPMYHPADESPETLAEIEKLTEENKTFAYQYELPDGTVYSYQPPVGTFAVVETMTVGDFTVDLTYAFSAEQKTAIQYTLQAWSDQLSTGIPIKFELGFASLSGSTLAQASTSFLSSGGRAYPVSVYNHVQGYDVFPSAADFTITYNSNFSFSYGTTGSCPAGYTDFVSVFLHEVAHGLGFTAGINSDGTYLTGYPSKWADYLYYNGSTLNTMTDSGRYTAIRSTVLYWDGPNAKAANGGSRIQMYAPSTYASGSSVSHWDTSVSFTTFMKYAIAAGTYCRAINACEAKLLKDVGWTLTDSAPGSPTNVSAGDGASIASVAVSWTASSGATGYDVYRHTSDSYASASLQGSDITGTAYTDSTATPGVLYYYWVKAKNASGSSAFSGSNSGYRALSVPTGVSATDSAPSAVTVTWSASTGASYYQVYRATTSGGTKTALSGWQTTLSYADSSAVAGTTYYYWVAAAVDGSGTRVSAYSTYDTGLRLTVSVPPVPTAVSADDGTSAASVPVSWTAASGASGYSVYRYTSNTSGSAGLLGGAAGTTYADSTATPGALYFYWVKATNSAGASAFSASDSGYRALSAPAGVSATDTAEDKVSVTWSAVTGASFYKVYRATSSGGTKTALGTWQSVQSYDDTSAVAGTTYYYWVAAAVDNAGTRASAYSAYDAGLRVVPSLTLAAALDTTGLTWTTGGNTTWAGETTTTYDGVDAAQSGDVADSQSTWVETTVTGPGTISFKWSVSSESGFDKLYFKTNGVSVSYISGTVGWTNGTSAVAAGAHTLRWSFAKDNNSSAGSDCGWLDQVVWTPSSGSTSTTSVPVPYTWLETYRLVSGGNYEAAALADADGDGYLTWQEYVAGTVPTNRHSVFMAAVSFSNGVRSVTWAPNLGGARVYTVEGKAALGEASWSSSTNATTRFFRVKVSMP